LKSEKLFGSVVKWRPGMIRSIMNINLRSYFFYIIFFWMSRKTCPLRRKAKLG